MTTDGVRHIGLLLFPDVEELDAIGPWEVLSYWVRRFPEDVWNVMCASREGDPVVCAKGLTVHPQSSVADMPELEVLLHLVARALAFSSTTG